MDFILETSNMAFGRIIMISGSVDSTINNPATVFLITNNSTAGRYDVR